jgi:hypothetical protein
VARRLDQLIPYVQVVSQVYFPYTKSRPYLLVFFPENTMMLENYEALKIRRIDSFHVVIPSTVIPRTFLSAKLITLYRKKRLVPLKITPTISMIARNFMIDYSWFFSSMDLKFKPANYRMRYGQFITRFLFSTLSQFPRHRKVLIYMVDVSKNIPYYMNSKLFPILKLLKTQPTELPFDDLLLCTISPTKGVLYRLLVKDRDVNYVKVLNRIRMIKTEASKQGSNLDSEEVEQHANTIASAVSPVVNEEVPEADQEVIQKSVSSYLVKKNLEDADNDILVYASSVPESSDVEKKKTPSLISKPPEPIVHKSIDLAFRSIVSRTIPNPSRIASIASSLTTKEKKQALTKLVTNLKDEFLEPEKVQTQTTHPVVKTVPVTELVDNKVPGHIIEKRKKDFETNLIKDSIETFKVLESKDIPVKIVSYQIKEYQPSKYDVSPSDISILQITIRNYNNQLQKIQIHIPKVQSDGKMLIDGKINLLVNQMFVIPITFPERGVSIFRSAYSTFTITLKETRSYNYFNIFIAAGQYPLALVLCAYLGLKEALELFSLSYRIETKRPRNISAGELLIKVAPNLFLIITGIRNKEQELFANSFRRIKFPSSMDKPIESKDLYKDIIEIVSGSRRVVYVLFEILSNIVDSMAKQILLSMYLPVNLPQIIYYMCHGISEGKTHRANDLTYYRLRSSEIFVNYLQKYILAQYSAYREQVLAGNHNARFEIEPNKILTQFRNSEIVSKMEYQNPVEELAEITKVTFVGKTTGAISREAVSLAKRNLDPSYYSNIDPVDTPEGGNVGINQQLAIGSYISSGRGIFGKSDGSNSEGSGILSTTSSLIPFIETDDGARVMMATQQMKQALPLNNPEPPAVMTGYEGILTNYLSDKFVKRSPTKARVLNVSQDSIILQPLS